MTLHPETIARVRGHIARNLRLGQSWDDMRRNANASAARLGAEIAATITSPSEANNKRLAELFERAADMRARYAAFDIAWIGATQPERLPPLAATGGGRGGCQQPRRGTFLRASLTAYNPKGDTLRTERSMLQCGLAISITALTVLGMAITAVAAPYTPKSGQCYSACEAKCAAQHSCERSAASQDCFTHYNQCKAACRSSCSQ